MSGGRCLIGSPSCGPGYCLPASKNVGRPQLGQIRIKAVTASLGVLASHPLSEATCGPQYPQWYSTVLRYSYDECPFLSNHCPATRAAELLIFPTRVSLKD